MRLQNKNYVILISALSISVLRYLYKFQSIYIFLVLDGKAEELAEEVESIRKKKSKSEMRSRKSGGISRGSRKYPQKEAKKRDEV